MLYANNHKNFKLKATENYIKDNIMHNIMLEALELHFSQLVPVESSNVYLSDTRILKKNLSENYIDGYKKVGFNLSHYFDEWLSR